MAITQTDVDNLEKALASGVLKTVYEGAEVTFRSVPDLKAALAYAKAELAAASGLSTTQSFAQFTRC